MSCYIENDDGKRKAVLTFSRDQLLYDIKNYAYVEGSIMEPTQYHNNHTVQDVGEEGNVDRVTRVIDLAMAHCRELLYPYTKHELHRTVLDNELREPGMYGIVLSIPSDYSQTTLNLLERLVHEYIVCKAVADWLSITNPAKAEVWHEKADAAESEVRTNLHTRMSKVRRRMHPF